MRHFQPVRLNSFFHKAKLVFEQNKIFYVIIDEILKQISFEIIGSLKRNIWTLTYLSYIVPVIAMKPITKENLLSFYLPVNSLISYTALSVNIMNPALRTK